MQQSIQSEESISDVEIDSCYYSGTFTSGPLRFLFSALYRARSLTMDTLQTVASVPDVEGNPKVDISE
jgi:hypothetical protein